MSYNFYPSGARIADRYEVAGRPLVGGMGIVYLCFDHQQQRPVALKTFKPEYLPNRNARERFLREGATWVALGRHPHIVHAYGVERIGDGREAYLILELVAKEKDHKDASLRAWLTSGQSLPADQAILIALQIVRGMAHAAETIPGFVHRDLKPENVLIGADYLSNASINRVRITDFGLMRGVRAEQAASRVPAPLVQGSSRLTRAGSILGTPHYMAPEQWERADVEIHADIYALGCIMGELLVGHILVQGGTLDALRRAHQDGQAFASARPVTPVVLHDILAGCLAVKSSQRYQEWKTVEAALVVAYGQLTDRPAPKTDTTEGVSLAEHVADGWSSSAIGCSYVDIGDAQSSLGYFQRAIQVGQANDERRLAAAGLNNIGNAYLQLGNARRAIGYYEQALAIHLEICTASTKLSAEWRGGRFGEGAAWSGLGNAYLQLGDAQRASDSYEQALAIHHEISDKQGEGAALSGLGIAYRQLGDQRRAIGYYEQALAIARKIGDRRSEGTDLSNLGSAYRRLGDTRRAIDYYEQALAIDREIGNHYGEGKNLGNLGLVYVRLGAVRRAIGYYEQALAVNREIGNRRGEGTDLGDLGSAYLRLGDARQAISYYEQALTIHREIGDRRGEGIDLGNMGNAYLHLDNARQAIGYYEQALTIHREISDADGVARVSFNMALLHAQQGDSDRALPLARESAHIWNRMGYADDTEQAQQLVAQLERQGG